MGKPGRGCRVSMGGAKPLQCDGLLASYGVTMTSSLVNSHAREADQKPCGPHNTTQHMWLYSVTGRHASTYRLPFNDDTGRVGCGTNNLHVVRKDVENLQHWAHMSGTHQSGGASTGLLVVRACRYPHYQSMHLKACTCANSTTLWTVVDTQHLPHHPRHPVGESPTWCAVWRSLQRTAHTCSRPRKI